MHVQLIRLALGACFLFLIIPAAVADPATTPIPGGGISMPTAPDLRPTAAFVFADGTQVITRSTNGRFRLVGLHLNETVDIALQSRAVSANSSITAQSVDGGEILSFTITAANRGVSSLASIRFQAGNQPGLYRVLVPGLAGSPLIQFWVADPANRQANRPVLNPEH